MINYLEDDFFEEICKFVNFDIFVKPLSRIIIISRYKHLNNYNLFIRILNWVHQNFLKYNPINNLQVKFTIQEFKKMVCKNI